MQQNLARAEGKRRPFCVYLSHRAGHPPFQAPEGIAGMYDEASVEGILPDHVDPWWYGKANGNVFQGVMMGSYYGQYRRYCETLTAMDRDIVRRPRIRYPVRPMAKPALSRLCSEVPVRGFNPGPGL